MSVKNLSGDPSEAVKGPLTVAGLKRMLESFPEDMEIDVEIEQTYAVSPGFTELAVQNTVGKRPRLVLCAWEKAEDHA